MSVSAARKRDPSPSADGPPERRLAERRLEPTPIEERALENQRLRIAEAYARARAHRMELVLSIAELLAMDTASYPETAGELAELILDRIERKQLEHLERGMRTDPVLRKEIALFVRELAMGSPEGGHIK